MIRAVIFDIGGILEPNYSLGEVASLIGLTETGLAGHAREHHVALTDGHLSLEEFYRDLIAARGTGEMRVDPRHVLGRHLEVYRTATSGLDSRVLDLIEELKKRYLVACLTNTELEVAQLNRERGLFRPFHRSYLSTELGLHKPDPAIFEHVVRDLGCTADQAVFTDDKEANVAGAVRAGLRALHYRDFDGFRRDLWSLLPSG